MTNIKEYVLSYFIQYYKNSSSNIISQIENQKAIEFLDEQVRKEKKEFKRNIINKNKNDKNGFINIIRTFLNNNFYYLSQKYIIYRVIVDVFEQISEKVESSINDLINNLIGKTKPHDLLETIYYKKCEDLKERIDIFLKKNKIIQRNNRDADITTISRISSFDYPSSGLAAPVAPNS